MSKYRDDRRVDSYKRRGESLTCPGQLCGLNDRAKLDWEIHGEAACHLLSQQEAIARAFFPFKPFASPPGRNVNPECQHLTSAE